MSSSILSRIAGYWPQVASDHGAGLDRVTLWVHVLIGVLFVAWSAVFFIALWRFGAGRNRTEAVPRTPSRRWTTLAEVAIVVVEAVLLLGLSIPLFSARLGESALDAADAVEVRVIAQQYAWNFHYPGPDGEFGATSPERVDEETNPVGLDRGDPRSADDVVLQNQLHLPVDRTAILRMTSKDVIHAFSIVEMRVKRDIIPGSVATVSFRPNVTSEVMGRRLGSSEPADYVYEIACAQLCGLGHSRMRGVLTVHTQASYDDWLAGQQAKPVEPVDPFWD